MKAHWRIIMLVLCCAAAHVYGAGATAQSLLIKHVTIVSPERPEPMRDATVHIKGDRIVAITPSSRLNQPKSFEATPVIDGRGLYLTPGLIDSHVHTGQVHGMLPQHEAAHPEIAHAARVQIPRSYLYFGFTTLVDLDSTAEQIARWNAHPLHPDIYFCGAAPIVDGYPTNWIPKPRRYEHPYLLVQKGEEASAPQGIDPAAHTPEAVVARMKADGALCVKTYYDERDFGAPEKIPVPRLETIRALVKAAHAASMPVLIHALSTEAQVFALETGADIIAHGLWHWNGEAAATGLTPDVQKVLDTVMERKVGWQPTMQVMYGFRDLYDPQYLSNPLLARALPTTLIEWYRTPEGQFFYDQMAKSLPKTVAESDAQARWKWISANPIYQITFARNTSTTSYLAAHNGRLLFGTDPPSSPLYTNPPGLNGWMEMHRLVEAGVTPAQIFRAATLSNAEALGLAREIGTLQVGKRANLLLLRGNPMHTVQAYDEIVKVVLSGRVLDRAELAADDAEPNALN